MAIGGMCSNESGIENSRMFIGAPPAFVVRAAIARDASQSLRPSRRPRPAEGPRREAAPARRKDGEARPASTTIMRPYRIAHKDRPPSAVHFGLSKISEPSAGACGVQNRGEEFSG